MKALPFAHRGCRKTEPLRSRPVIWICVRRGGSGVSAAADTIGGRIHVGWDSVRRNLGKLDEAAVFHRLQDLLDNGVAPVLSEPWILDSDVIVTPLYGRQEGAV